MWPAAGTGTLAAPVKIPSPRRRAGPFRARPQHWQPAKAELSHVEAIVALGILIARIFSENRLPSPIGSGTGFFRIMIISGA
jgi:hypothetical protein